MHVAVDRSKLFLSSKAAGAKPVGHTMLFRRHRQRRWIALIALLGLLFQQVALATHVCPGGVDGAAATQAQAPCHPKATPDQARCQSHCSLQLTITDHAPLPAVPAAILPPTTWIRSASWQSDPSPCVVAREVTARAAAPPISIRHCSFQI